MNRIISFKTEFAYDPVPVALRVFGPGMRTRYSFRNGTIIIIYQNCQFMFAGSQVVRQIIILGSKYIVAATYEIIVNPYLCWFGPFHH